MTKFIRIKELSDITGLPIRLLRTLAGDRRIPSFKVGHRTQLFDVVKVQEALERYEIKEVGRQ